MRAKKSCVRPSASTACLPRSFTAAAHTKPLHATLARPPLLHALDRRTFASLFSPNTMADEAHEEAAPVAIEAPVFRAPRMVSRPKPQQQQEEEIGSELKLGEFEGEQPLSISEARAVVTAVHEKRKIKAAEGHGVLGERTHNDSQYAHLCAVYRDPVLKTAGPSSSLSTTSRCLRATRS